MAQIKAKENESIESILRRFKKLVENEGILKEYKERRYFQKPSLKKRLKMKDAERKNKINQRSKKEKETFSR